MADDTTQTPALTEYTVKVGGNTFATQADSQEAAEKIVQDYIALTNRPDVVAEPPPAEPAQ